MYYILITVSSCMFSLQFLSNSAYSKNIGSTVKNSLQFTLYTAAAGLIFLLAVNKFHLAVSPFSLLLAFIYAFACLLSTYCNMQAFRVGNLAVFSVFCMLGGMLLPSVYGLFCGEKFSPVKILCFLLLVFAVCISSPPRVKGDKSLRYYIGSFFLNGACGTIMNIHQNQPALSVDSGSFMMLYYIVTIIAIFVFLKIKYKNRLVLPFKGALFSAVSSFLNTGGNYLLMLCLLHLPASVQFPFITGGTIVFSTIISLCRKEHPSKRSILSALLALIGTICIAL